MLKRKIDSLEGLEENLHDLYEKSDNGYVLKVEDEGGDPDSEVLERLQKLEDHNKQLFAETKAAKKEAKELQEKIDAEKKQQKQEKGEFEELYNQQIEENKALKEQAETLAAQMRDGARNRTAESLAKELTRDSKRASLLAEKIASHVEVDEDNQPTFKIGGVDVGLDKLKDHVTTEYDFLVDGDAGSGGGAPGSRGGGAIGKKASEMNRGEKSQFIEKHGLTAWESKVRSEAA